MYYIYLLCYTITSNLSEKTHVLSRAICQNAAIHHKQPVKMEIIIIIIIIIIIDNEIN